MKNKIYINIPANVDAGGCEALYQLADGIRSIGEESYVIFHSQVEDLNPIPEKYRDYNIHIATEVEDYKDNWIIYPEIWTDKLNEYNHLKKGIWWLSVDNNFNKFQDWGNKNIIHFYQSYYAFIHILNNGGTSYLPIFEYINNKFLIKMSLIKNKQDFVCYNPVKGGEIINEIINSNPDIKFVPLINMTEEEVINTLSLSKVYIDFGHHPGRDRIPREAAILNNCVITNLIGGAKFYNDIPIKSKYKLDSYNTIGNLIKDCFVNFKSNLQDFEIYRNFIKHEKQNMIAQITQIFKYNDMKEIFVNKTMVDGSEEYIIKNMSDSFVTNSNTELYDYIFKNYSINGEILEFGVFEGKTVNYFADSLQDRVIYGFDSFEGLPEKWRDGYEKGTFDLGGKLPDVRNNIKLVKGWFKNSIPDFLSTNQITQIGLLHIDCDIYSSTKTIFELLGKFINKGTIIIFDEYFNYPGWKEQEFKAFQEFIDNTGFSYEYISFNINHEQVAIIITETNIMKKVALISTFCDNQEKLDLLIKNIKKIKSLGIDVMIISPLKLNDEVIELCDFSIFSKENPILNWPEKSYFQWWGGTIDGVNINMTTTYPDHGYAGLLQFKRMADFALSMDYKIFFPMIYDINITPHVESVFNENKKNSFFPSYRDGMTWPIGLHLISLDREHLIRFKTLITKESYLVEGDFDAFAWLHRAVKLIPGVIEEQPIEDLIYFLSNKDFFNCSPSDKFKCFIHKTLIENDNIKIVFYNFGGIKHFNVKTDLFENDYEVREWDEIKLPFLNTDKLIITNDGETFDLSHHVNNIGNNTFTKS